MYFKKALTTMAMTCMVTLTWAVSVQHNIKTQALGTMHLECENAEGWDFATKVTTQGSKEFIKISMKTSSPQTPPTFTIKYSIPQKDMAHVWSSMKAPRYPLRPNWASDALSTTQLAISMPLYQLFNESNRNRLTMACDEVFREVKTKVALLEENCMVDGYWQFFTTPEAPLSEYHTTIMLDTRDIFWADALREATQWMDTEAGIKECQVPKEAFAPLYSSWYQFHQNVHDKDIEEECRIASQLGMKTLIVDDGWQTDDNQRGYAYCGDWKVSPSRFPNMAAHVKKVQDMGMKYMMWYSVPFVGKNSKAFEQFKDKYLRIQSGGRVGVLDPRFPEVREFLINTYETALKTWNIDGFKLDFIDQFNCSGEDPAVKQNYAGRDIKALPEAVNVLMKEVTTRLSAIKPNILIEFRQKYIGPAIRQYGNMLRVSDCPGEMQANRIGIANLRLTSGHCAVHADMLEWNNGESALNASRTIQNCLFGVIQYSVMLRNIPDDHKKVISHWLAFTQEHEDALLHGYFKPYNPEASYPLIEAGNEKEHIIGVYQDNMVININTTNKDVYVINATTTPQITVNTETAAVLTCYDMMGKIVSKMNIKKGLQRITIPGGGYAKLNR